VVGSGEKALEAAALVERDLPLVPVGLVAGAYAIISNIGQIARGVGGAVPADTSIIEGGGLAKTVLQKAIPFELIFLIAGAFSIDGDVIYLSGTSRASRAHGSIQVEVYIAEAVLNSGIPLKVTSSITIASAIVSGVHQNSNARFGTCFTSKNSLIIFQEGACLAAAHPKAGAPYYVNNSCVAVAGSINCGIGINISSARGTSLANSAFKIIGRRAFTGLEILAPLKKIISVAYAQTIDSYIFSIARASSTGRAGFCASISVCDLEEIFVAKAARGRGTPGIVFGCITSAEAVGSCVFECS
jgi:hypothetical protein